MLDLTFTVRTDGGLRAIRIIAERLEDPGFLDEVLRRYDRRWLRPRIEERFQSRPGWPERTGATTARLARTGGMLRGAAASRSMQGLRRKLHRDLRRAKLQLGKIEEWEGYEAEHWRQQRNALIGRRALAMSEVLKRRMGAVERAHDTLAEFERLAAGGAPNRSLMGGKRGARLVGKLQERMGRAARQTPLLGKIASSFKTTVSGGRLVDGSEIPWAGIHNEGGIAGHGAVEPARPFAFLEDLDVEVLVGMIVDALGDDGAAEFVAAGEDA